MVASMLALAVVYAGLPAARLEALSEARRQFRQYILDSEDFGDKEYIYSMGPGEQKVFGFWPVGRSDRRFLYAMFGKDESLLFQKREGDKVVTKWELKVGDFSGKSVYRGTIANYLKGIGAQVKGKITADQAKLLNDVHPLAAYAFLMMENAQPTTWIVYPDGTTSDWQVYDEDGEGLRKDDKYLYWPPITALESKAMGLGSENWPLIWKFTTMDLKPNQDHGAEGL